MTKIDYSFECKKADIKENIIVIIIIASFLITLNYSITAGIFLISAFIITIIDYYLNNEKFRNKTKKVIKVMWYFALSFAIIDTIATLYAVHIIGFANELNPFVKFLWEYYGIVVGEFYRWLIIGILFTISKNKLKSDNKIVSLMAVLLILFKFFLWGFVIIWNINQIYLYHCA